ncbi:retinoic acid-induced protein 1 isoform X2 [Hyperolius riggenbachi]|uniref:retinoic acid-induced protein 1 isoform X2 n=1 Tax=Hyperolius riggenbachi TaxID=752182 RepID=UPI0035A2DBFE
MQSFQERCGFHGNQQNYQPSSQESSRLENYRQQSQPGLNCVRQRQMTKGYYVQTSYQGYENNTGEKYPRGDKHMNAQQLQGRVSFASFPEANFYPGQYEEGMQNWGQTQAVTGAKYEENAIKKTPAEGRGYPDPSGQMSFHSHTLHPPQQPNINYPKSPRQKVQNDIPCSPNPYALPAHFNQNFPTSTYSSVPGGSPVPHTFKSCTSPSNPSHERAMATAANPRVQAIHGYQSSRMSSYEPAQRHHAQETLHYQNMAKYHGQHYSQQNQAYCQPEAPSRTPDQYYQPFSPSASHSPARSVGRSPSYSSTPSPLMTNLENFQYNQQQHNPNTFPMGISDHSHYMPLLNPSPTGTSSPESQTKSIQNDKIPESLLSNLSLQSLTALTSQVENISSTVQQLLLSKSGIPQKKGIKSSPRTPESLKTHHCGSESSAYSSEPMGTPLSETLGTPQSVHAEIQDADYLSGSEDQLERNYMYCGPGRSPGRASSTKMKPESISTCSVTSPDNLSTKSDDSFQSIHSNLPLETFAKLMSSERECPHLLVNALTQEELSTEIIALQEAIDNEKAEKAWTDSPELNNTSPKSPFNLEDHTCVESVAKNTWSDQGTPQPNPDAIKKITPDKTTRNHEFNNDYGEKEELPAIQTNTVSMTEKSTGLSTEKSVETSISNYAIFSNTVANATMKTSDPFEWPDKSMSESCLRWKEIEMTLTSDLQKGLFQSKVNKVDSRLDVPDVETPLENDSGEEFNKEGAEDLAYTEADKADNEKWLEDTRDCYNEDEFQDIPDLPSQKGSNQEPEDYSSLCDFSERKSLIEEESLPKPTRESEALSPINTPDSIGNPSNEEKGSPAESTQLNDSSIMLLGPTVETESKVNSWFESTLPHIKAVQDTPEKLEEKEDKLEEKEDKLEGKEDKLEEKEDKLEEKVEKIEEKEEKIEEKLEKVEDNEDGKLIQSPIEETKTEISTLLEVKENGHQEHNKKIISKDEEPPVKKPQRGRRSKAAVTSEAEKSTKTPSGTNDKAENENIQIQTLSSTKITLVSKYPVTEAIPARMCTRSSTARVEGQDDGVPVKTKPHEKLIKSGALSEKEKVPPKVGRRGGKMLGKVMPRANEQEVPALPIKQPSVLGVDTASKENSISILKDDQSMILRSRSKKKELFPVKRRRGKKGMNFVIKKRAALKKIIANNCSATDTLPMMPKNRKQMKLGNTGVGINVKNPEKALQSLKRKSSFISPVPAKKKNLILRGKKAKEQKSESPPILLKKMKPIKKEKLQLASKKTCKVILGSPAVQITPEVCLKVTSRASYHGALKTKVLPPRKGRGLKMEAIVQKITSPNQKKQGVPVGGLVNAAALSNSSVGVPSQAKELRDRSLVITDSEAKLLTKDMAQMESPKSEAEKHTVGCRGPGNRAFKRKPFLKKKKIASNVLHAEVGAQPVEKTETCKGSKRLNAVPKKKLKRGRAKGAPTKAAVKKLLRVTASVLLTPKDKSLSESALLAYKSRPKDSKKVEFKEDTSIPESTEEAPSQTRARKKTKPPTVNGYVKKQRKCPQRSKPTNQTPGRKRRGRGHSILPIAPKEPEIKLKYVSTKPVRAESRVRLFAPYVQVERKNAFTTTCTVINSATEEARLEKERTAIPTTSHAVTFAHQGTLPSTSRMTLGPVVCKSVSSGCLLCCLCRCPANYKDLGDLCGPYYPVDCLPSKKFRLKDKLKPEEPEKPSKVVEPVCEGSGALSQVPQTGSHSGLQPEGMCPVLPLHMCPRGRLHIK